MQNDKLLPFINNVLKNMPSDWLNLTTHRLDIYNESLAKTEFLEKFEELYQTEKSDTNSLLELPTAYDYIRLGHPLSSILEWAIALQNNVKAENVITFSSKTVPLLAILRSNLLRNKNTLIVYKNNLPKSFDTDIIKKIYGYKFDLKKINDLKEVPTFDGDVVYLQEDSLCDFESLKNIDFQINLNKQLGSILLISSLKEAYVQDIQHVRRRETIAMTPANTLIALKSFVNQSDIQTVSANRFENKKQVYDAIRSITGVNTQPIVASSGLSTQYAIVMGLVHEAFEKHPEKTIKFIVPTNCYGGTNDQARRVAACIDKVDVVDLLVDGGKDMVQSIDTVLDQIAQEDAIAYIIAEIPTNPRVEVPEMIELSKVLSKTRKTQSGNNAVTPVFILDQTFCPNTLFLGENEILANTKTLSYVSGSKFPSGGKCTAGYCTANKNAASLMDKIALHLAICDNEATDLQYEILAIQMPSMNKRISDAYSNTRDFVNFITKELPTAKINFVSEELAAAGFTPSVFSLDLPTKGNTDEERETYKRELNLRLINMMITEIPSESKYCVSYGQLKGCYWTIPATSTQGTTKEGDKDYIARVAVSANLDLDKHKEVFLNFVRSL